MQGMKRSTLVLGAIVALAPAAVLAQGLEEQPTTVQGTYSISAHKQENGTSQFVGCVVMAGGTIPTLRNGGDPFCRETPDAAVDHRWNVYRVGDGHVIKSPANGRCLIRGNNGTAANPSLYSWQSNPDKTYCGLANGNVLVDNGQAHWALHVTEYATDALLVGYAGRVELPRHESWLSVADDGTLRFSIEDEGWEFYLNTLAP